MISKFMSERQDGRMRVVAATTLSDSIGIRLKADLFDISAGGFSARISLGSVAIDRLYLVRLRGLEALVAKAIWRRAEYAGFAFLERLHPSVAKNFAQTNSRDRSGIADREGALLIEMDL